MAHEFVGKAERRVHHALLAHQDAVVEPPAVGEAHLLELLDFLDEAEGARRGDLAAERLEVGEAKGVLLAPDGRRVVEDVVHLEAVGRLDRDALVRGVIGADGVALVDDQLLDRGGLVHEPALVEERAQLERRAVEDRHLGLHLHQQVGDPVAVEGRHQVLDRPGHHAPAHERGRVARRVDVIDQRRHRLAREYAPEDDAAPRREGLEDEPGAHPRVEPLPVHQHAAADGALREAPGGRERRRRARRRRRRRLGGGRVRAQRAPDDAQERVERERLLEEVEGPEADDAHRGLDRAVPRDDDDRHPGRLVAHALDQLDAVHLGHPHVHDREPRGGVPEQLEGAASVGRLEHLEALVGEHAAQRVPDVLLVVHHQDRLGHPSPPPDARRRRTLRAGRGRRAAPRAAEPETRGRSGCRAGGCPARG